jgi:hemolysin activation/secretion protein
LRVEIVEGRLTAINLERATDPAGRPTRKWLRDGYLTNRIELDAGPPLSVLDLRDRLELIRQDPHVKRINAELRPGALPGEAALDVSVEENFPGQIALVFSNRRPPSVGAERLELLAGWNNVLGFGDSIALRYGINKGELDDWQFAGLDDFTLSYTIPITPRDTTLTFELSRSDSTVVEQPFDELDLDTESARGSVTLRHPFYRTPATELAGFVGLSVQHTTNRLLGERIDLSPGSVEGESNVTAVRFGGEFFTRNTQRAISVRSTLSLGIDAFEATIDGGNPAEGTADAVIGDIPDGQFFSWLGQAQYVQRLGQGNTQFIARIASQLTSDPLLGPEQFAIGGFDTVRGYRENQVVRDNGVVGTLELRLPLISKKAEQVPILELAPFVDAGYAFNRNQRPGGEYLVSIGLGLLFNPNEHLSARVYWGQHLNDVNDNSGNLQDLGIHFNIQLTAF